MMKFVAPNRGNGPKNQLKTETSPPNQLRKETSPPNQIRKDKNKNTYKSLDLKREDL